MQACKLLLPLITFCFFSCSSVAKLVESGGKLADGTYFNYKANAKWIPLNGLKMELKNITWKTNAPEAAGVNVGDEEMVFAVTDVPYITFYGTVPDKNGVFALTRAHFLAGNYGGWNEFDVAASGGGRALRFSGGGILFSVFNKITLYKIIDGKIRRDNTRLIGERATSELSYRNERINFLINWMKSNPALGVPEFNNQIEFENFWSSILFTRRWDTIAADSNVTIPQELREMRENGALEADWNEASSWIYLYYDWNKITSVLNREAVLKQIK
jgi:hypothetical protein